MLDREIYDVFEEKFKKNPINSSKYLEAYDPFLCTIQACESPDILIQPYLCQKFERLKVDIIEQFLCSFIWQEILHGEIDYVIHFTEQCFSDNMVEENRNLLKSYIENDKVHINVIDCDFWGGTQGADGYIKLQDVNSLKVDYFPLEVGYCKPTQFFYHLFFNGKISRLPYNSNYVVYFYCKDPWRYRPKL